MPYSRLRLFISLILGMLLVSGVLFCIWAAAPGPDVLVQAQTAIATPSVEASASSSVTSSVYLPIISSDFCPSAARVPSPFSIEIAALHQIEGLGDERTAAALSSADWLALYETTFVTLTEALRESGAGWARVRIDWSQIQPDPPPAGYVWGPFYDERLRLVAETPIHLIATVAAAPDWAADSACKPIYPERLEAFGQFLNDLVARYKRPPYNIKHWELFNEPDYAWPNGWAGGLGCWAVAGSQEDGERYAQMLAVAYEAIKRADPEAKVLMGGVGHDWFTEYGGPFDRYFPDDVMAYGGGDHVDLLNFHYFPDFRAEWERWVPHGDPPTCGLIDDGQGAAYEAWGVDLIAKANHFRNRLSTCFGVNKPLWVTELAEHGYANNPESLVRQARYVIKGYVRGLAAGVENITWYALVTPNDSYEQGLLYADWTPKPAFFAYRIMTAELRGYTYAGTLEAPHVEGYWFRNPCGKEKTIAWGSGTLSFAPAARLRVVDREGNATFIQDGDAGDSDGRADGAVVLQLSDDPVFVSRQ